MQACTESFCICACTQVYTTALSSDTQTAKSWEAVPANATVNRKQTRFSGQPLAPHYATREERWDDMEGLLAQLLHHLTGCKKPVEDCKGELQRWEHNTEVCPACCL